MGYTRVRKDKSNNKGVVQTELCLPGPPTAISTILSPIERRRVDSVADGTYPAIHRNSVDEIVEDLRSRKSGAVLLSVLQYDPVSTARMAAMVREFPRVPAYGLITEDRKPNPHSILSLGQAGVRSLIDLSYPSGWDKLRDLLFSEQEANDIQRIALESLSSDLADASTDCRRFFEILFAYYPYISSVRQLARQVRVLPTTLLSRFYRVKLPSPKQYIDFVRLIRAAHLLENSGLSVSTVAEQLDYSSPQAFSRHTRCVLGVSPGQFRRKYSGESMLHLFRERLIFPYVETLNDFRPIAADPGWISSSLRNDDAASHQPEFCSGLSPEHLSNFTFGL